MAKNYIHPSLTVSPYPYIGIVKSYDKIRKYGYIMVMYKRDIFFHIKNSNILDLKPNMLVSFKVRVSPVSGRVEAYELDTIFSYKDELIAHQDNLLNSDLSFIYYCHPQLIEKEIHKRMKEEFDLLSNIDNYINSYDILKAVDSYRIEVVLGHRYKPGDDDAAWVNYEGDRKYGVFLIDSKYKYTRDVYMDTILPPYREEIFHDSGYCPWSQMLESFGDLSSYRLEAVKKTTEVRLKAKEMYNKLTHKETIVRFLTERISTEQTQFQHKIEKDINDSLLYSYHLSCRINDITFK